MKGTMVSRDMKGSVVVVLNIGETPIPCAWFFGVVHVQYMHDHSVYNLCLAISLGVEGGGFVELGVQQ
jgi:hypothetical protein